MKPRGVSLFQASWATLRREWLSHRLNRFLYWHLGLLAAAGILALLVAPENSERGVAWFLLHGVLYVVSLSSVLLGLSSAQAEMDELPFLATQPMGLGSWLAGKAVGLVGVVLPSGLLLVVPWLVLHGWSGVLVTFALASAAVCVALTLLGLAVGLWVRESVRALLTAVGVWFVLLFGTDLLLLVAAGSPWIREHPGWWVAPLMLNPLDALRVLTMLAVEGAALSTLRASPLVQWWAGHPVAWLASCVGLWCVFLYLLAWAATRRIRRS